MNVKSVSDINVIEVFDEVMSFGAVYRILHSLHHRFQADSGQRSAPAGRSRDCLFHRAGDILDQKTEIDEI